MDLPPGNVIVDQKTVPNNILTYFKNLANRDTKISEHGSYINGCVVNWKVGGGLLLCYKPNSCRIIKLKVPVKPKLNLLEYKTRPAASLSSFQDITLARSQDESQTLPLLSETVAIDNAVLISNTSNASDRPVDVNCRLQYLAESPTLTIGLHKAPIIGDFPPGQHICTLLYNVAQIVLLKILYMFIWLILAPIELYECRVTGAVESANTD